MRNLLLSVAIGDIAGQPYEFNRTKDYNAVDLLYPKNDYTDDTVMTFACAEALLYDDNIAACMRKRGKADVWRGYGTNFADWLFSDKIEPAYYSYGNGSAMRVASAGFIAMDEELCVNLAECTALPTHNHPEGIKGAVATALAIFHARQGRDKDFIRQHVLDEYYPRWSGVTYEMIHPTYVMDESCQGTVPAAIISFLDSKDYADCLKLAISLGGDADTLAAIAGPIAYAYYREMPEELIANAKSKLPQWMLDINDAFDAYCSQMNALLATSLNDLSFSINVKEAFNNMQISTVDDLIHCDYQKLHDIVGANGITELDEYLESIDLTWRNRDD